MSSEALFLNGVYEDVLKEILQVQGELPEQIMFLQPHKNSAVALLRDHPPSVDAPVPLLMSLTDDLATVHFACEIVGWDDKRKIPPARHRVISRLIYTLQPNEGGLYDASHAKGGKSVNLLHVRRVRRLRASFGVSRLINSGDGQPLSDKRTSSGGWVYVRAENLAGLIG